MGGGHGGARRLTWAQVSARRMGRQGLTSPLTGAGPADAVAAMCGAHAQVLSAAELSVGLRLVGATRSDARAAVWDERTLVKTFGPRGTVHLLPTRDLPMWTGALSALPRPRSPFADDVRLTDAETELVLAAVADALDDAVLTVDELTAAIVERVGTWAGDLVMPAFQGRWPRWRQALALAGTRGVLCFGPDRGRNVTYTSPRRWLPDLVPHEPEVAVDGLLRSYLRAYGPVTEQHLATWLNTRLGWAADRLAGLGAEVERVEVEGSVGWQLAADEVPAGGRTGVRLLPYFDAYVVACQPRQRLFRGAAAQRALSPSGQAGNYPVLLVDGTVAGVWHLRRSGRTATLTVEPLGRLSARRRRLLDDEAARVGEVLETTVSLTVGPVTVGPHA
jgi:hypothetical protein